MPRDLRSLCQWCRRQFSGSRKFCTGECRRAAQESKNPDPTEEEIRQMCCRIREDGGEAWERSHTCYAPQPYHVPVVAGTRPIMRFLAQEVSRNTYVNLMDQYRPEHRACRYESINRPITSAEYTAARQAAREEGLSRFDTRRPLKERSP